MGLLNSALHIGRSALLSYQSALEVVGSNISSAASPDYTRLRPELDPLQGQLTSDGLQPGAGVALSAIQRYIDEGLENRVRLAIGDVEDVAAQRQVLAQVETYFDELNGSGVGAALTEFFNSLDTVQNNPEDSASRDLALTRGGQLASAITNLRADLTRLGVDTDDQIEGLVTQADELGRTIAELNQQIVTAESAGRGQATGLRDQRDALLRELAEIVDVTVRSEPDGAINVYLGSEALIQGSHSRGLTTEEEISGEFQRTTVRFADTGGEVRVRGGKLEGLIRARDKHAYGRVDALDELARGLIFEVNRLHAEGQGMRGFTEVAGSNTIEATDVALNSAAAGLTFPPLNGSFFITVTDDATGTPVGYRFDVTLEGGTDDTTLDSLVAEINAAATGLTAEVTSDKRLALTADAGYSFTFGHDGQEAQADTAYLLAALGLNTFFEGRDARDLAVNEVLAADSSLLAAAQSFLPGDGTNAGRMAGLDSAASSELGGATLAEFYAATVYDVATASAEALGAAEATSSVLSALQVQKESISGVNLDEEAIALVKYERSFQGAARFISVVDQLLQEVMALAS